MKTIDEVRAELKRMDIEAEGRFLPHFGTEVLRPYLPEEYKPGLEGNAQPLTEEAVKAEMLEYLKFGFEKAINHRGLSAGRTIEKLRTWLWILEDEELVAFLDDDRNYVNYGMPMLKRVAAKYNFPIPDDAQGWDDGKPCHRDCDQGCSF